MVPNADKGDDGEDISKKSLIFFFFRQIAETEKNVNGMKDYANRNKSRKRNITRKKTVFRSKKNNSPLISNKIISGIILLAITLGAISFLYFDIFHRFLELKTYQSMFTNETSIIPSTLRNNQVYVSIYLTWMKIIIIEAIPYISILTLNICILKKVYNASKYRQSFR